MLIHVEDYVDKVFKYSPRKSQFRQYFFKEIINRTKSISKDVKIKDSDCFVFIILTHGNENGLCGTDGDYVPLTTLTEMFEPNNCPEMNEKPKIFLIQACRGG